MINFRLPEVCWVAMVFTIRCRDFFVESMKFVSCEELIKITRSINHRKDSNFTWLQDQTKGLMRSCMRRKVDWFASPQIESKVNENVTTLLRFFLAPAVLAPSLEIIIFSFPLEWTCFDSNSTDLLSKELHSRMKQTVLLCISFHSSSEDELEQANKSTSWIRWISSHSQTLFCTSVVELYSKDQKRRKRNHWGLLLEMWNQISLFWTCRLPSWPSSKVSLIVLLRIVCPKSSDR